MAYRFKLADVIPASPAAVYDAWLDSGAHSAMTGGKARMSARVGAAVSAWDGYISGRNLELVPGARIVQSWRSSEFGDEYEDSIVTITLEDMDGGTLLTLEHSNVPAEQRSYEEGGWQENYFEPMMAYFAERKGAEVPAPAAAGASKASAGSGRAPAAKSKPRAKRTATKTKRAAPRKKTSPRKSKRKAGRIIAAAAKRKRRTPAKRAKRKMARGKKR